jgi:hypothetical protein
MDSTQGKSFSEGLELFSSQSALRAGMDFEHLVQRVFDLGLEYQKSR